jgi:hypothetical protein
MAVAQPVLRRDHSHSRRHARALPATVGSSCNQVGMFVHRLAADFAQIAGEVDDQRPGRGGVAAFDVFLNRLARLAVEGPLQGQQLIQRDAKTPDVDPPVRLAVELFGSHVRGRSHRANGVQAPSRFCSVRAMVHATVGRAAIGVQMPRQSEIDDPALPR